jgi:hypothetical protein
MARTPESLLSHLQIAMIAILANITGQYTSCDDGYFAAPDVPGVRVRLVLEIDPARARGPSPRGTGWQPRPEDPEDDAPLVLAPRAAPPRKPTRAAPSTPATRAQRGLFDEDEDE